MKREQTRELLPIIEAWANGADIQVRQSGNEWIDMD